jgi:hypothetical protein
MPASVYPTGTTIYDPEKCWNGYTSFSAGGPAQIIDMNGNVVNSWQGLSGQAKMFPGGYVTGTSGRAVGVRYAKNGDSSDLIQVDWDGNIVWEFNKYELVDVPGGEPVWRARWHHDFQREGNPVGYYVPGMDALVDSGNTLILCHKNVNNPAMSDVPILDCTIIEVTWEGEIIWEWACSDHVEEMGFSKEAREAMARNPNITGPATGGTYGPPLTTVQYQPEPQDDQVGDWVHMNAISYLGPNKWFDMGDERFHPENIIWDGRQTNIIAIIDKKTGKLVWQVGPEYSATEALRKLGQIIGQHQAHMIPRGLPGEGNILVYDNGGRAGYGAPNPGAPTGLGYVRRDYSRVLEFDPTTLEIVWQHTPIEAGYTGYEHASYFYSPSISGMQRLPNGNTLICEGQSGRLIEVTPEHETVWEYVAPLKEKADVGFDRISSIYRAYRVPYEWVPQVDRPEETAIPTIDSRSFRVPGSPPEKAGKVTTVKYGS